MGRVHLIPRKHRERRGGTRRYSEYEDRQGKPSLSLPFSLDPFPPPCRVSSRTAVTELVGGGGEEEEEKPSDYRLEGGEEVGLNMRSGCSLD